MKLSTILLVMLLSFPVQAETERDTLYWSAATLMVLDGFGTSNAINSGKAKEVGLVAVKLIGEYPNDRQIAGFTALNLGLLEWSRHWPVFMTKTFQWTILITRPRVIAVGFSF